MVRKSAVIALLASGCLYNRGLYDARLDALTDEDGDGFARADDCDDGDPAAYPGAEEAVADGVDQDCDGGDTCRADLDGDGFGGPSTLASPDLACDAAGEAEAETDCDDGDEAAFPGADETFYDGVDQNCDPSDDDDADGDGYAAYDRGGTDCDDADAALHPGLDRTLEVPSEGFPTIQSAIDASCDGDIITLSGGVFEESIDLGRHDVTVTGNASLRGTPGDRGPVVRMARGTLEGMWIEYHEADGDGGCVRVEGGRDVRIAANTAECETTGNGGGIAVLDSDGVTIGGNHADDVAGGDGGAVYVSGSTNVAFEFGSHSNHRAGGSGGAIAVRASSGVSIAEVQFGGNEADDAGGAVFLEDVTGITTGLTLFLWNRAGSVGSSAAIVGASEGLVKEWAVIQSFGAGQASVYVQGRLDLANLFVVDSEGAGIHVRPNAGDDVALRNLLVLSSGGAGLVVQTDDANALDVSNSIIAYNAGYGLLSTGQATPSVRYSDLYANTLGDYAGVSDLTGILGNLSTDPRFLQYPSTLDVKASVFLLRPDSPLVDAGDPEVLDPDGSRSDLGMWAGPDAVVFEYYEDLDDDGLYDGWESEYGTDMARDDAAEDADGDHLTNAEEFDLGTVPNAIDSDGDGFHDAIELDAGTDPIDRDDAPATCSLSNYAGPAPAARYALEDVSSGTLVDAAGDADATATGGVVDAEGKVGRAALFDGTGEVAATRTYPTSAFTWTGWVRVDALPTELGTVASHGYGPEASTGWRLAVTPEGRVRLALGGAPEAVAEWPWAVTLGQWTWVAAGFDGTYATISLDGYSPARVAASAPPGGSHPFTLGYDPTATTRGFVGAIDEVTSWDAAVLPADVAGLLSDELCGIDSF